MLEHYPFLVYWDGEPDRTLVSLDPVTVPPAVLVVLHIVIEHEYIRLTDLVKKSAPGNIGGLKDDAFHSIVIVTGDQELIPSRWSLVPDH